MIVAESDLLTAALDRRMQVDRLLAIEPLAPVAGAAGESRPLSQSGPSVAAAPDPIVQRLPLGQNVAVRVIDILSSNQVVAEVAGLVVNLAWPGGTPPTVGGVVMLRVLSHSPLLLFENPDVETPSHDETDTPLHLSPGALGMQSPGAGGNMPVRFRVPILEIEIESITKDGGRRFDLATGPEAAISEVHDQIALDNVIVARSAHVADQGMPVSSMPGGTQDPAAVPVPLILQGPAWHGQDVELVVRRERADESFDNPVLDQWRGDLVIDLPYLGRVAGHLAWSMQGLRIRLEGQDSESVDAMNAATADLASALASVDLPVLSMAVTQPFADTEAPRHV